MCVCMKSEINAYNSLLSEAYFPLDITGDMLSLPTDS